MPQNTDWRLEPVVYYVSDNGPKLVAETTPNPEWDLYGVIYLMVEMTEATIPGLTVEQLVACTETYNAENGAELPCSREHIQAGLDWLVTGGMLVVRYGMVDNCKRTAEALS